MKSHLYLLVLGAGLALPASAASINFETPTYPDSGSADASIVGVDGWSQSEANENDADFPLFYTTSAGANQFGNLSGFYAAPLASTFSASRSLDLGPAPTLGQTFFSMQVSIQPSSVDFPENDSFGFSLTDGTNSLLDVMFVPDALTGATQWAVNYTIGGGTETAGTNALLPTGLYDMFVAFDGTGLEFLYGSAGAGAPLFSASGTPVGYVPASTANLELSLNWEITSGNAFYGDGGMLVDNIITVPEPAIFGLASLAGLTLLRRRRRPAA